LGGQGGGAGQGGTLGGSTTVRSINAIIPTIGQGTGGGLVTKTSAIRFVKDGQTYETGYLEDVHIVSSARINALIVSAPTVTMRLIEKLIESLDTVAAARSYVNVFQLHRGSDANLMENLIAQLFTGQGRQATTGIGGNGTGGLGTTSTVRPLITLTPNPADGASLIDLRLSVDDRTNSLIVAGSLNDLQAITAIVARLEGAEVQTRYNEVYKLRNAAAADVANAVQTYFTNVLAVYTGTTFNTAYQILQRQVVVIAEPVSNTVLISATPEHFGEIKRIIDKIDSQPPQVMIQVLIAEVQLNNAEELGVEAGLQSPLFFTRGNTGTTYTPGFNFNTPAPQSALPNVNLASPSTVGFQGVSNLGVGRTSATQGFGGFVFSASSNTFSLLVRALKAQGRVDVLSRPQLQVGDNQTGFMNVGQNYPILTGSTIATGGLAQQGVTYVDIGVTLQVTPRVNPDGKILMRVAPSVSSVAPTSVNLGNGVQAPSFDQQTVQTTVLASDGETIVIGGLITKQENRQENGVPYFKDLPHLGVLFRYRTHTVARREILIIMTPHIIRSEFDQARILAEESARLKWCLPEIGATHLHGMEVMGPASHGARPVQVNPGSIGPNYFGPFDPSAPTGVGTPGSMPQTSAPAQQIIQPGMIQPGLPLPAAYLPTQAQPAPTQPGQVPSGSSSQQGTPVAPGSGTLPQGQPGAAAPQFWQGGSTGVMPVSAAQPAGAPAFVPQQAPNIQLPYAATQPGYTMAQPGATPAAAPLGYPGAYPPVYPGAAQPLVGAPGPMTRNYMMTGGQPQPQSPPAPLAPQAPSKDASPASLKPFTSTDATEGKSWTFGR
jgi:type II secretory pathway component GspD/PulD (secretin)